MTTIALDGELGIEAAAALKASLGRVLKSRKAVVLDGAAVTRLHAAALQVLVAFVRDRRAAGRDTTINPSAELAEAAQALGVASVLGLDPVREEAGR